ncbi:hypothetical protein QBC44DRAFT_396218, partial [Cladorrhinum sp. PSN332]
MDPSPYSTLEVAQPRSHQISQSVSIIDKEKGHSQDQHIVWTGSDAKVTPAKNGKIIGLERRTFFILVWVATLVVAISASVAGSLVATRISSKKMMNSFFNDNNLTSIPTMPAPTEGAASVEFPSSLFSSSDSSSSTSAFSSLDTVIDIPSLSIFSSELVNFLTSTPTADATSFSFKVTPRSSTSTSISNSTSVRSLGSFVTIRTTTSRTESSWMETTSITS